MPEDRYGPLIEDMFRDAAKGRAADRGVTVNEVIEELGCVSGRVYQWLRKPENAWRVRQIGKRDGSALWVLDESQRDPRAEATKQPATGPTRQRGGKRLSPMPRVTVGDSLELVAIESVDVDTGEVTVIVLDAAGRRVRARLVAS